MSLSSLDQLARMLRPAGGGVHLVSTGREAQETLQKKLYRVDAVDRIPALHHADLARLVDAKWLLLGVPSDVGAGVRRGANFGPAGIREGLLRGSPEWSATCVKAGVVDVGDVFSVPQLLHDDMLSESQRQTTALALYPDLPDDERATLPVSPLSIEERVLDLCFALNPELRPLILGGDHSTAWPVVASLVKQRGPTFAIVQFDAHTDLLPDRLGIKYCFATWSFHANALLGRGGRLLQLGVRASRFPKAHWESTLGVRQWWADECRSSPGAVVDAVRNHLDSLGISAVYVSNDIDGTDAPDAPATGTPEPDGLSPAFVREVIRSLRERFDVIGGDLAEVAPPLSAPADADRTCDVAASYVRALIDA